ncbi:protein FAM151B-like isoform X1 [Varroa jacobsoni]|uniref:Menorin-like domain-containing protein n=1 Tax=Varroa destructor TaxID=109461 RepID=A0A7M7J4Y0_VARDE|nr:protein FAM151B-like isoform X3 [Varroa destructor]XP_022705165.1 protein FAM151B-like isoform X1 [Varroa jacobsoni]
MSNAQTSINLRWSHATNSRVKLINALKSDVVDFIEGDVLLGNLAGHSSDARVPIMAHPPDTTSDILFSEWIRLVKESRTSKGIKVDFKDFDAVESCLSDIAITIPTPLNHELWLNADVLVGPGEPKGTALPAEAFVDICTRNGPAGHVLSIGWTTELAGTPQEVPSVYSWKNIFQMIRLLDKVPRETVVTFPVRLSHLVFAPLTLLLSVKSATSLTVWSHAGDPLPKYEVMTFLLWAYPNRIYIDLSEEHVRRVMDLLESLRKVVVLTSTMKVITWNTTDAAASQRAPWGSPYAIVVSGPGSITVEVADPCRLKSVGISGDLTQIASHSKDLGRCLDMKTLVDDMTLLSQVTLTFIGSGEVVLFVEQPIP